MKNWIATHILKRFYRGYLIQVTIPYNAETEVTITIDIGRLADEDYENAVEFETSQRPGREWMN